MSSHSVIDVHKGRKPSHRPLRAAMLGLLISGSISGFYWQAIHLPRQRSEVVAVQLQELTESVEQLQALLKANSANFSETETSKNIPTKVLEGQPQSYWLSVSGAEVSLSPQPLAVQTDLKPETALKNAIEMLLSGPKPSLASYTTIPEGTRLLSLKIAPRGIYVDLSTEFGQGGGSSSMITRVAQILYTATCLEPSARVFLSVEGVPLDSAHPLGEEGLLLAQPLTRSQFAKDFPPNLLKSTRW